MTKTIDVKVIPIKQKNKIKIENIEERNKLIEYFKFGLALLLIIFLLIIFIIKNLF